MGKNTRRSFFDEVFPTKDNNARKEKTISILKRDEPIDSNLFPRSVEKPLFTKINHKMAESTLQTTTNDTFNMNARSRNAYFERSVIQVKHPLQYM